MKLHGYWRSSCSYRVRIALALKGLAYDHVAVHLVAGGGEQHRADYQAINPMRQVPSLILDDGVVLTQSVAIMEYLNEVYPEPALLPKDPVARARARAMVEVVNAGIQPLQNLAVLNRVRDELAGDSKAWAMFFMKQGLDALEALAASQTSEFLASDSPSMADACLVPQLYNANRFSFDLPSWPTLHRVNQACLAHPAFQKAHPDLQPDASS